MTIDIVYTSNFHVNLCMMILICLFVLIKSYLCIAMQVDLLPIDTVILNANLSWSLIICSNKIINIYSSRLVYKKKTL